LQTELAEEKSQSLREVTAGTKEK